MLMKRRYTLSIILYLTIHKATVTAIKIALFTPPSFFIMQMTNTLYTSVTPPNTFEFIVFFIPNIKSKRVIMIWTYFLSFLWFNLLLSFLFESLTGLHNKLQHIISLLYSILFPLL